MEVHKEHYSVEYNKVWNQRCLLRSHKHFYPFLLSVGKFLERETRPKEIFFFFGFKQNQDCDISKVKLGHTYRYQVAKKSM